jgi:hypothetical protein
MKIRMMIFPLGYFPNILIAQEILITYETKKRESHGTIHTSRKESQVIESQLSTNQKS